MGLVRLDFGGESDVSQKSDNTGRYVSRDDNGRARLGYLKGSGE